MTGYEIPMKSKPSPRPTACAAQPNSDFPAPMSAIRFCRGQLKGRFVEPHRQSGDHQLSCSTAGIGQAFPESHRRQWAHSSRSRLAAVWKLDLLIVAMSSFGRALYGHNWLFTTSGYVVERHHYDKLD